MQKRTTTVMVALVAAVLTAGVTPVQGQVDPDCDADGFEIADSEPTNPRTLGSMSSEVGRITVTGEEETVRVELLTVGEIEFGVFVVDTNCIVASSSDSTCEDDERVETMQLNDPQHTDCVLQPGNTYYFHVVNEELSIHEYKIWQL